MLERYLIAKCKCGWSVDFPWSDCGDDQLIINNFHAVDTRSQAHAFEGAISPVFRKFSKNEPYLAATSSRKSAQRPRC